MVQRILDGNGELEPEVEPEVDTAEGRDKGRPSHTIIHPPGGHFPLSKSQPITRPQEAIQSLPPPQGVDQKWVAPKISRKISSGTFGAGIFLWSLTCPGSTPGVLGPRSLDQIRKSHSVTPRGRGKGLSNGMPPARIYQNRPGANFRGGMLARTRGGGGGNEPGGR